MEKQAELQSLKAQGWYVQLVPGYQYVPDWVFTNYPGMYYVNQYGDRYIRERKSHQVINAPFNPRARALIASYIARIFQDFDPNTFDSIRIGGGVQGELRYPPHEWNGRTNSYWAFDWQAQRPALSGIPRSVVGWRPGIHPNPGSVNKGQLLVNRGFEQLHPYLNLLGWAPDDEVVAAASTISPHSGTYALRLTLHSPHRIHQFVPVEPGQTYHFGGWLRSESGSSLAWLFVNQYDAAMQPIADVPFGRVQSSSMGWVEQSATLMLSPATHYLKVEMDGSAPGTYFFDDLWVQKAGETNPDARNIDVPLAFYDWYVGALSRYQHWQIAQFRRYYSGQLDLVYPGKGILPHQITDALTNDLRGNGWSEQTSALYAGTAYDRHVAVLPLSGPMALYLTGIEEPPAELVDDLSDSPRRWSAARWIGWLAQQHGHAAWAENGGQNVADEMVLSVQRMQENGFLGRMWPSSPSSTRRLTAPTPPSTCTKRSFRAPAARAARSDPAGEVKAARKGPSAEGLTEG